MRYIRNIHTTANHHSICRGQFHTLITCSIPGLFKGDTTYTHQFTKFQSKASGNQKCFSSLMPRWPKMVSGPCSANEDLSTADLRHDHASCICTNPPPLVPLPCKLIARSVLMHLKVSGHHMKSYKVKHLHLQNKNTRLGHICSSNTLIYVLSLEYSLVVTVHGSHI